MNVLNVISIMVADKNYTAQNILRDKIPIYFIFKSKLNIISNLAGQTLWLQRPPPA